MSDKVKSLYPFLLFVTLEAMEVYISPFFEQKGVFGMIKLYGYNFCDSCLDLVRMCFDFCGS